MNVLNDVSKSVVVLAAPRGYGKSTLLSEYTKANPPRTASVLCLTDDQRAAHLAFALTRQISRAADKPDFFTHLASEYQHLAHRPEERLLLTPGILAQAISFDLNIEMEPLTIIIDGITGREQSEFVIELVRRTSKHHRFLLSGYEPLAQDINYANIPAHLLSKDDLAFDHQECRALGVSWGDHYGWPAAVAFGMTGQPGSLLNYLERLTTHLSPTDLPLQAAALLDVWSNDAPGAAELGLVGAWVDHAQALGWPLNNVVTHDAQQPHPLLRNALLNALKRRGVLNDLRHTLAHALVERAPIKALELQSAIDPTAPATLLMARQQLTRWYDEGQFTQIRTYLAPHQRDLTPTERAMYARAVLHLAGSQSELSDALIIIQEAREQQALTPDIDLILADAYLRLGQPDAAILLLSQARERTQHQQERLIYTGGLTLAQLHAGRAREVMAEVDAINRSLGDAPIDIVMLCAQSAALLATGQPDLAVNPAYRAHLAFACGAEPISRHVNAAYLLIDTLIDLDLLDHAEQLLALLTFPDQRQTWLAARAHLTYALLALRQHQHVQAYEALSAAVKLIGQGSHNDLAVRAHTLRVLRAIQVHQPVEARSAFREVQFHTLNNESAQATVAALQALVLIGENHRQQAVFHLNRVGGQLIEPAYAAELLLDMRQGAEDDAYGAGVRRTWGWTTNPAAAPHFPTTNRLEVKLLTTEPEFILNGQHLPITQRKQIAILAYLALNRTATREELSAHLCPVGASRSYIPKVVCTLREAVGKLVGTSNQDLIVSEKHGPYQLHSRLQVHTDLDELSFAPLHQLPELFAEGLPFADLEPAFAPYRNQALQTLIDRLRRAPRAEAQPILEQLHLAHPTLFELTDLLEECRLPEKQVIYKSV